MTSKTETLEDLCKGRFDSDQIHCLELIVSRSLSNTFLGDETKLKNFIESAVHTSVQRSFNSISDELIKRVQSLESEVAEVRSLDLTNKIQTIQSDLSSHETLMNNLKKDTLPSLVGHLNQVVNALALTHLNSEVNRRKYTLVVHGIKGQRKEEASVTRKKLIDSAKTLLGVSAAESDFAACHRLNFNEPDTGIHARFVDLSKRDIWLSNTKKLSKIPKNKSISISIDVPPCLRKVKKELTDLRKTLPPEAKRRSYVKHLPSWPYFQLIERDGEIQRVTKHSFTKSQIALSALHDLRDHVDSIDFELPEFQSPAVT